MFHGYAGNVKVRALTGIDGRALREWRRSRGWDVPKTARELRHAASEPVAAHHAHDDASSVTAWVAATNTTDDTIEEMDRAAAARPS